MRVNVTKPCQSAGRRILAVMLVFALITTAFTSCGNVASTVHTEVNVNVGNHPILADNHVTTTIPETEQPQPNDAESGSSWFNILLLAIGIPLSIIGIISLYVFIREVRKRKYNTFP